MDPSIVEAVKPINHKHTLVGVVSIVFFVVLILAIGFWQYSVKKIAPVVPIQSAEQTIGENQSSNLTSDEIQARQAILNKPNTPSKLTPAQIKARQAMVSGF